LRIRNFVRSNQHRCNAFNCTPNGRTKYSSVQSKSPPLFNYVACRTDHKCICAPSAARARPTSGSASSHATAAGLGGPRLVQSASNTNCRTVGRGTYRNSSARRWQVWAESTIAGRFITSGDAVTQYVVAIGGREDWLNWRLKQPRNRLIDRRPLPHAPSLLRQRLVLHDLLKMNKKSVTITHVTCDLIHRIFREHTIAGLV